MTIHVDSLQTKVHRISIMPLVEFNVNLGRLKGIRGILCALLCAAIISTVFCIGLFAGKTNDINTELKTDFCSLFATLRPLTFADPSICHYVIGGSSTVLMLLLVLLVETLIVVFFAFAFTDHLVMILLRGSAMFVSLILMFCVSIIISAGLGTTCAKWIDAITGGSSCSKINFDNKSSYLGTMVASAIFSWITTALLVVILVVVGAPLKSKLSRLKLSDIKKPLLKS